MIYRPILTLVVCSALFAAVSTAQAQQRQKGNEPVRVGDVIGLLQVTTVGVSPTAAEQFEASLEEGLGLHGFRVANRAKIQQFLSRSTFIPGCSFGPCLRTLWSVTKGRIPLVVVARIEGQGSSYQFLISLIDTKSGAPTAQIPTSCTVCTVEEAIASATLAVVELVLGIGDTEVLDPRGATGDAKSDKPPEAPTPTPKRKLSRTSYLALGAGAAFALAGVSLLTAERTEAGWGVLGGGVGLLSGGAVMYLLSRRF